MTPQDTEITNSFQVGGLITAASTLAAQLFAHLTLYGLQIMRLDISSETGHDGSENDDGLDTVHGSETASQADDDDRSDKSDLTASPVPPHGWRMSKIDMAAEAFANSPDEGNSLYIEALTNHDGVNQVINGFRSSFNIAGPSSRGSHGAGQLDPAMTIRPINLSVSCVALLVPFLFHASLAPTAHSLYLFLCPPILFQRPGSAPR
jgi:hypothetical protein